MARIRLRRKKRKTVKLRGKRYSGYGQVSGGHRKSGQRGGFGRAGVKDHRKIELLRQGHIFGSRGFTPPKLNRKIYCINIGKLVELVKDNRIKFEVRDNLYVLDLRKLGYVRVLGGGVVDLPLKLVVDERVHVTKKAEEKIKEAGGVIAQVEAEAKAS